VFSLLGLTLVLGLMLMLVLLAAIGLGPGDSGSLGPVPSPPRFEAKVGDSTPLGSARVASAVVAPGSAVAVAAGSIASAGGPSGAKGRSVGPAVGPAQTIAVAVPAPSETQAPGPATPPVAAPAPEAAPAPTLATAPESPGVGGGKGGPITAEGPSLESCEGDEYVITIVLSPEAAEEEQSVEIVLTKFSEDGSAEELRLEGDLLDAQSLALQLSSEGNCVYLEAGTATDPDPEEPAAPEAP